MAVKVTNKKPLSGNRRSHACNATKMQQKPNLQVVRLKDGTKVRLSTREARTLRKGQNGKEEASTRKEQNEKEESSTNVEA